MHILHNQTQPSNSPHCYIYHNTESTTCTGSRQPSSAEPGGRRAPGAHLGLRCPACPKGTHPCPPGAFSSEGGCLHQTGTPQGGQGGQICCVLWEASLPGTVHTKDSPWGQTTAGGGGGGSCRGGHQRIKRSTQLVLREQVWPREQTKRPA